MEAMTNADGTREATKRSDEACLVALDKLTATDVVMIAKSLNLSPAGLFASSFKD